VADLSDGSSNGKQKDRFTAGAKAHAASSAKLGLPRPEFAVWRRSSGSAGLQHGTRHALKCYSIMWQSPNLACRER